MHGWVKTTKKDLFNESQNIKTLSAGGFNKTYWDILIKRN